MLYFTMFSKNVYCPGTVTFVHHPGSLAVKVKVLDPRLCAPVYWRPAI